MNTARHIYMVGVVISGVTAVATVYLLGYAATQASASPIQLTGGVLAGIANVLVGYQCWRGLRSGSFPREGTIPQVLRVVLSAAVLLLIANQIQGFLQR